VAPAILIECDFEASGIRGCSAPGAGHIFRVALARVFFAHPTGIFAKSALHWSRFSF
jgi:hypothetical protein